MAGGGNGGGLSRGPIGANGLRPMLGRASASANGGRPGDARAAPQAPTYRVPGASVAARAAAAAAAGPRGAAGQATATATRGRADEGDRKSGAVVDEDGFQVVRGRGWKAGRSLAAAREAEGMPVSDGGDAQADDDGRMQEEEQEEDDGGDEEAPSAGDLRQAWRDELALVKRLRQQGIAANHPAMVAACNARDEAERQWRGAKDPTPLSVKLARAQAKLDRAIVLQAEARQAILDHEKASAERLAVLQTRMDEDTARVRMRRRQLEETQAEMGTGGGGGRTVAAQGAAVKKVHGSICNEIAPALAALAEQVDTSAPAWTMLNSILSSLSSSQALLEQAIAPGGTQAFDIGDAAEAGDADDDEEWNGSEWSESHEVRGGGTDAGGDPPRRDDPTSMDYDEAMGSGDWWGGPGNQWRQGTRWESCGHGQWQQQQQRQQQQRRSSWADSWEEDQRLGASGEDQPAAVRRRLDPQGSQPTGDGGRAPPAPLVDEAVEEARRKQQHERRIAHVVQRAIDAGIQPLTESGEELQLLSADQLQAWVAAKFPMGLDC